MCEQRHTWQLCSSAEEAAGRELVLLQTWHMWKTAMRLLHSRADEKWVLQSRLPSMWAGACKHILRPECLFLQEGRAHQPRGSGKAVGQDSFRREKDFFFLFAGGVD